VHYVGRLKSNNKQFDSSKDSGKVFKFRLGSGEVIKAWDLGVEGMKVENKRFEISNFEDLPNKLSSFLGWWQTSHHSTTCLGLWT
jgi:hypothetical protein